MKKRLIYLVKLFLCNLVCIACRAFLFFQNDFFCICDFFSLDKSSSKKHKYQMDLLYFTARIILCFHFLYCFVKSFAFFYVSLYCFMPFLLRFYFSLLFFTIVSMLDFCLSYGILMCLNLSSFFHSSRIPTTFFVVLQL